MVSFDSPMAALLSVAEAEAYEPSYSGSVHVSGRGFVVSLDHSRDDLITPFGKSTLRERYLLPGETIQDAFARVACAFADDEPHAQRMYDYISRLWFIPATPVLSNGGAGRGMPISCFLSSTDDSLQGIVDLWTENVWLASNGGGIGNYWGNLRSIGERVGKAGFTSGIMPFIAVQDRLTLAISQGSLRRGSSAVYLDVSHPEIEEFLKIRKATGGDPNRKALNLHHGIVIPDAFMEAVAEGKAWPLTSPKDGHVVKEVDARSLMAEILIMRLETGEPYLLFIDQVNRNQKEHTKKSGNLSKFSNLCISGDALLRVKIDDSEPTNVRIDDLDDLLSSEKSVFVWAFDEDACIEKWALVTNWAQTSPSRETMRITDEESGRTVVCTPDHKLLTKNRGWQQAQDLTETDELVLSC